MRMTVPERAKDFSNAQPSESKPRLPALPRAATVLPVERRHALRARFGAAPPSQLQVTAGQIVAWAAEAAAAAAKAAAVPAAEAEECGT